LGDRAFPQKKITADNWGKSVVKEFSQFIQSHFDGLGDDGDEDDDDTFHSPLSDP
jgi:hypothetical protein